MCDSTIDHLCGTLTKQPKKISLECGETSFAFVIRIDCIPTHPTLAMFCGGFDVCLGCAVAQFLEAAKPTVLGGCKQKKKKGAAAAAGFIQRDFSVPLCPTVSHHVQQFSTAFRAGTTGTTLQIEGRALAFNGSLVADCA